MLAGPASRHGIEGAFYEYDLATAGFTASSWSPAGLLEAASQPVRLIEGARSGPLEDSGGFLGFEQILNALADPSRPNHADYAAWVADVTATDGPSRSWRSRHCCRLPRPRRLLIRLKIRSAAPAFTRPRPIISVPKAPGFRDGDGSAVAKAGPPIANAAIFARDSVPVSSTPLDCFSKRR